MSRPPINDDEPAAPEHVPAPLPGPDEPPRLLRDLITALQHNDPITADEARYISAVLAFSDLTPRKTAAERAAALGRQGGRARRDAAKPWHDEVIAFARHQDQRDPRPTANMIAKEMQDSGLLDELGIKPDTVRKFLVHAMAAAPDVTAAALDKNLIATVRFKK